MPATEPDVDSCKAQDYQSSATATKVAGSRIIAPTMPQLYFDCPQCGKPLMWPHDSQSAQSDPNATVTLHCLKQSEKGCGTVTVFLVSSGRIQL